MQGTEPGAHVIVGFDGSAPSRAALDWAVSRARLRECAVVVAYVVNDEWGAEAAELLGAEEAVATQLLDTVAARERVAAPELNLSTTVVLGRPATALALLARPQDLIVVGTHKTGYLRGRVLGSLSVAIASAAACNVMVVPESRFSTRSGVVVGVGTVGWRSAVVAGALEAQRLSQELRLIHAVGGHNDAGESGRLAAGRALLAAAAHVAASVASKLEIQSRVSQRGIADTLLDASRLASILILGDSRDSLHPSFVGSVAHDVLLNINSPVLIVRHETPNALG